MSWFDKLVPTVARRGRRRSQVPAGLWRRCTACNASLYKRVVEENLFVCPKCNFHIRIGGRQRLDIFLDPEDREELAVDVEAVDQLNFRDVKRYRDRLKAAQKNTGEKDALVTMRGKLAGRPVVAAAFEFAFLGGSMGYAVGERFKRAAQQAQEHGIPLISFAASGGARMQEALISLVQMAKTSAVLERLKQSGIPYISVLTDPVYGGVSASLASLGDVNIAEPLVRAGFAGPNIIQQTMRIELPDGFQSSEFLLSHGVIDMIVSRQDHRQVIASLLSKMTAQTEPAL